MAFQNDNESEGINDINITPFVDVVLVLLVIFMVTAPMMVKDALELKLPKSESSDKTAPAQLGISITKNGQFLLNGELVSGEEIEVKAIELLKSEDNVQALLSADTEAKHGDVIRAIDHIKKAGIENFAFQIEKIINEGN
jgi:biopolymer transport protein ExbD